MSVVPSCTEPDWQREAVSAWAWDPGRQLLRTIREYQQLRGRTDAPARVLRGQLVLRFRFWAAVTGAEIPLNSRLGGGLQLPHPNGIVIHPEAEIGPNCLIFQQVTLGTGSRAGVPRIGGGVVIGAGAKVLGGVVIGNHVRVGANSVVIGDVPEGVSVAGVPARVLERSAG